MLTIFKDPTFLADAAPVASVISRRKSSDPKRRNGYVQALAGRCAR